MAFSLKQAKAAFFDRKAVSDAIDRGARRGLSRFGAFVRTRDRSSMKYKKGKSSPGAPPFVHRGGGFTRSKTNKKTGVVTKQASSPLRDLTLFAYDATNKSVVIGAAVFERSKIGGGLIPKVVEEGGTSTFISGGIRKTGLYAPRPHLGPAYKAELPKAAAMLKGMIR